MAFSAKLSKLLDFLSASPYVKVPPLYFKSSGTFVFSIATEESDIYYRSLTTFRINRSSPTCTTKKYTPAGTVPREMLWR